MRLTYFTSGTGLLGELRSHLVLIFQEEIFPKAHFTLLTFT